METEFERWTKAILRYKKFLENKEVKPIKIKEKIKKEKPSRKTAIIGESEWNKLVKAVKEESKWNKNYMHEYVAEKVFDYYFTKRCYEENEKYQKNLTEEELPKLFDKILTKIYLSLELNAKALDKELQFRKDSILHLKKLMIGREFLVIN